MDVWDQGCMNGVNEHVRVHVGVAGWGGSLSSFNGFVCVSVLFFPLLFRKALCVAFLCRKRANNATCKSN